MPDKRYTILHLDDEEALGQILQEELWNAGYDAHYEASKAAGYDWVIEHRPDLIISDVKSPGMDGLQFLHWIKLNPMTRRVPFMFLTAFTDLRVAVQSRKLGVDDFIAKPFDIQQLLAAISRVLSASWSPSIYPPLPPPGAAEASGALELLPWNAIDELCRRMPGVWSGRIHYVGVSDSWASFFVAESENNLIACGVDRPFQYRVLNIERVLSHHRWMREIGADYGMLMGFFEPDPRICRFARQIGIEVVGVDRTRAVLNRSMARGDRPREQLLDFLRVELRGLDGGAPFTDFAERIERQLALLIGKRFDAGASKQIVLKHAGPQGMQIELPAEPQRSLRLGKADLWMALADLWSEGTVVRHFMDQRPEHAACLFEILSHLPSIERDDEALRLRDKPNHRPAKRQTVAVLEDNEEERAWMCEFLRQTGYSVIGFEYKNAYLELLQSPGAVLPNLVITDLHAPGISGEEFIRTLRCDERLKRIPIMVVSRHLDGPDALGSLRHLGVTAFLRKPCEPHGLLDAVGKSASRPQ
jgi:CheY-like chemotaxis protein